MPTSPSCWTSTSAGRPTGRPSSGAVGPTWATPSGCPTGATAATPPSPFDDLEAIYTLDPFEEYGTVDVAAQAERYQAWYADRREGCGVITGGLCRSVISFAIAAFRWENLLPAAGTEAD